jgi:hypothetical protein
LPHRIANYFYGERFIEGCLLANKERALSASGCTPSKIRNDGFSSHDWQGQRVDALAFGTLQLQGARMPIEVINRKGSYFPGAKPQVHQTTGDGIIAAAYNASAIKRAKKTLNLLCCEDTWQRLARPLGNGRYCGHKRLG